MRQRGKPAFPLLKSEKTILKSIRYVDEVIPEDNWEQKTEDIQKNDIDIFVMGDDWEGKFDALNAYCKVIYLPRTENISSTIIKAMQPDR